MEIKSLSRRTDLMFARFDGKVISKEGYTLIQTPSNPGFHWGNYIIFNEAPAEGDYEKWTELYRTEFDYYKEVKNMVFTWDTPAPIKGEFQEFLDNGFTFSEAVVLTTNKVHLPVKSNKKLTIKKILSEKDWAKVVENQIACRSDGYDEKPYRRFKERQIKKYKMMSAQGLSFWFGAFIGDQLIGDLGIYHDKEIGRFQNVGTHPSFRRQGVCGTLVFHAAQCALSEWKLKNLVMEADANYHAAKVYESVGFRVTEKNYDLSL